MGVRIEMDLLGELAVPDTAYYGIQTERARRNFAVSGHSIGELLVFIRAIAKIKKAAALANSDIGALDRSLAEAIGAAADEIIGGSMAGQFPVDIFQGGGSTSTNMNVNEVIANRASEILEGKKGYMPIHPNTHVNLGQSTNDVIPAAISLASYEYCVDILKSLQHFVGVLKQKELEFCDVVKVSRTCMQDAVPITLGQEFSAYVTFIKRQIIVFEGLKEECLVLSLGATASGTSLGIFPGYIECVYRKLSEELGVRVVPQENFFDGLQHGDGYVRVSAALKGLATGLGKMARDLRIMSSGPRAGLNEIVLPAVQPGSSIMPGKVNPVMPELMNQIAYQVCGDDVAITMAVEGGELDLNVWEPVIIKNLSEMFILLTASMYLFADTCVAGIKANQDKCRSYAETTLANATVISAIFGYEIGTKVAQRAHQNAESIKEAAIALKVLTPEEAEIFLDPLMLTDAGRSSKIISKKRQDIQLKL